MNIKQSINKSQILKLIILIMSFVLPLFFILDITFILQENVFNIGNFLGIGFYSCVLLIFFIDKSIPELLKIILVIANFSIIFLIMYGSLMEGYQGLLIVTIKIIFPFIPIAWLRILIFKIFGYTTP